MALPFHMFLLVTMVISLVWGIAIFIIGVSTFSSPASLLDNVLSDIKSTMKDVEPALQDGENQLLVPYAKEIPDDLDIKLSLLGAMMIMAGAAIIVFSAFGIFAALKRVPVLLFGLIATIAIAMVIELLLLYLCSDTGTNMHMTAKDNLVDEVRSGYTVQSEKTFNKVLNSIMMMHSCCGILGVSDFKNLTYSSADGQSETFQVPPACCNVVELATTAFPTRAHQEILTCARTPAEYNEFIYKAGCYDKMFIKAAEDYGTRFTLTLGLIVVWQVIQIILAILTALSPADTADRYKEDLGKEQAEVKKQFIPFSKVSSYVSSDVNRIKSTEIW